MLDKRGFSMHNACMSHAQRVQTSRDVCFVRAYAKINLTLDVLGRRADGYHELATVMQTVDLYDTLCLTAIDDNQVQVICTSPALSNDENLAGRAARIPMAAGLGGGSSDAAAVLLALQQWWQLPFTPTDLLDMAASLGSDVPFFLTGGLALCEGRGERVSPLPAYWPLPMRWLLLLKPSIGISTAAVFRSLSASDYTDGRYSQLVCGALSARSELQSENLHNGLERSVLNS